MSPRHKLHPRIRFRRRVHARYHRVQGWAVEMNEPDTGNIRLLPSLRGGMPPQARPALFLAAGMTALLIPLLIGLVIAVLITLRGGGESAAHAVLALVIAMLVVLLVLIGAAGRGLALWYQARLADDLPI